MSDTLLSKSHTYQMMVSFDSSENYRMLLLFILLDQRLSTQALCARTHAAHTHTHTNTEIKKQQYTFHTNTFTVQWLQEIVDAS